jgi:uncharacterized membrane protein YccC
MALFTVETSLLAAQRSIQSRRDRAKRLKDLEAQAIANAQKPVKPIVEQTIVSDFQTVRLTRVREQLDRIDSMLSTEEDPKRIKELADATARLQEQERQLANRPMPGSLRPQSPKHDKRQSTQATFDSPLLPADQPAPKPQVYDGPENG